MLVQCLVLRAQPDQPKNIWIGAVFGSPLSFCEKLLYSAGIPDSGIVPLTFATTGDPHG